MNNGHAIEMMAPGSYCLVCHKKDEECRGHTFEYMWAHWHLNSRNSRSWRHFFSLRHIRMYYIIYKTRLKEWIRYKMQPKQEGRYDYMWTGDEKTHVKDIFSISKEGGVQMGMQINLVPTMDKEHTP